MSLAGTTTDVPLGAIIRGSGRSRSSSPGVESHPDYDRSRSADRGKGSSAPEQEVFVSVGNSTSSSSSPKLQPATITERLRQVVGSQCDGLPVLVGLVCGSLARQDCNPGILREELKPHLPAEAKAEDFEDFLAWLDQENKASPIPRPKDPRLSQTVAGVAFKEAEMVRLCALEKRPELNGCKAEVLRVNDPSQPGRIVVKLESGSQLAIRPENLQQIVAESPELPKSPKSPKSEKPEPANKAAPGPDPAKSSVFGAAFAKLKAKAEAEARGELPERKKPREKEDLDKRGGIGSSLPAGQARRELVMGSSTTPTQSKDSKEVQEEEEPAKKRDPITFVAAEGRQEPPSRRVTVIDPRRPKRPLEEESDDEDVGIPGVVRPRCPPGTKENGGPPRQPTSPPQKAAKATPEPVCQMPAAPPRGLAKTVPTSPVPSKTFASPLRRPNMPLQNMTLVVSDDAREADKAQKELAEKKRAMEEGKRGGLEVIESQTGYDGEEFTTPAEEKQINSLYTDLCSRDDEVREKAAESLASLCKGLKAAESGPVKLAILGALRSITEKGHAISVAQHAYALLPCLKDENVLVQRKVSALYRVLAEEGAAAMVARDVTSIMLCFEVTQANGVSLMAPLEALSAIAGAGEGTAVARVVERLLGGLRDPRPKIRTSTCATLAAIARGGAKELLGSLGLSAEAQSDVLTSGTLFEMLVVIALDDKDDEVRLTAADALRCLPEADPDTCDQTRQRFPQLHNTGSAKGEAIEIISSAMGMTSGEACVICQEPLHLDGGPQTLLCGHIFHRKQMLEKLTKQMQICLSKLQNPELDDKAKERYQDMITTLKNQMSKIGNV
eukprot:s963_g9.t1